MHIHDRIKFKITTVIHNKGPSIATQLNSTWRRVELRWRVAIDTSPTQLNSTPRRVELYRYKRALKQK